MNVQAACDHHCRFQFIGVAGPGVMGDRQALFEVELGDMIEQLPGMFFVVGDAAYTPTEHLLPILGGEQAKIEKHDNYNFFASQLRIRIEMAFGLMVKKWGILQRPLVCDIGNAKHIICAIARLHNFVINERLAGKPSTVVHTPRDAAFDNTTQAMRDIAALVDFDEMQAKFEVPWSANRDAVVMEIAAHQRTRPSCSRKRKQSDQLLQSAKQ